MTDEPVADPLQYVHAQIHCQRRWLPLWHYAERTGLTIDALVEDIRSQTATHPASRDAVLQRLGRTLSAFAKHVGRPAQLLKRILEGETMVAGNTKENIALANAIMGLPEGFQGAAALKPLLVDMLNASHGNSAARSAIYRAACRVDELLCT